LLSENTLRMFVLRLIESNMSELAEKEKTIYPKRINGSYIIAFKI
jgi:hypothetical protein